MVSAQNWASIEFKSCCPKPCVADNWKSPKIKVPSPLWALSQCLTVRGKKPPSVPNDFSMKSRVLSSPQFSHLSYSLTRSVLSPKCFPDLWARHSPIMVVLGLFSLVYFVWGFKFFHNNMVQEYQPGENTDSECSSVRGSWEEVGALFPQVGYTLRLWKLHD